MKQQQKEKEKTNKQTNKKQSKKKKNQKNDQIYFKMSIYVTSDWKKENAPEFPFRLNNQKEIAGNCKWMIQLWTLFLKYLEFGLFIENINLLIEFH